jgi:hypothetical protein
MSSAPNVISVCAGHNALSKKMLLRTAHAALRTRDVSYWHKADMAIALSDVRFWVVKRTLVGLNEMSAYDPSGSRSV